MGVEGVLLDSRGVALRPIGGRWNPRFDFEDVVARHHPALDLTRLPAPFAACDSFLHASPADGPWEEYHRHLLGFTLHDLLPLVPAA